MTTVAGAEPPDLRRRSWPTVTPVQTQAVSPWRQRPVANPDYLLPTIAAAIPPGRSVAVECRGAATTMGSNPTAWSTDVDVADGMAALQCRVNFIGNRVTGAVASVDTLVVPIR